MNSTSNLENPLYWDIDDILAEEEKINVVVDKSSYRNGSLNPNCQDPEADLEKGSVLEIPLWLALFLAQIEMVEIEIPRFYRENFKNTLLADPTHVNLREKTPFYYEIGLKLCKLINDRTLVPTLSVVFLNRVKHFAKISFHLRIDDSTNLLKKMANFEMRIFNNGRKAANDYREWKEKGITLYDSINLKLKKIKI